MGYTLKVVPTGLTDRLCVGETERQNQIGHPGTGTLIETELIEDQAGLGKRMNTSCLEDVTKGKIFINVVSRDRILLFSVFYTF